MLGDGPGHRRAYSLIVAARPRRGGHRMRARRFVSIPLILALGLVARAQDQKAALPSTPLAFGAFVARFDPAGTFTLDGQGWPALGGTFTLAGDEIALTAAKTPQGCETTPGRYRVTVTGPTVAFAVVEDTCRLRKMIVDGSVWRPAAEKVTIPVRQITAKAMARPPARPAASATGSWPSFRGAQASGVADGQRLPDTWNAKTGENIRWHTAIPGLAHSSPIVWGDRACSSRARSAAIRRRRSSPGLYGDGDASDGSIDASLDALRARQDAPGRSCGSASPWRARRVRSGTSRAPTRARRRRPTAGSSSPGSARRACTPTTSTASRSGTSISGGVDMGAYDIPTFEWGTGELADHLERSRDPPVRHAGRLVHPRARCRDRQDGVEDRPSRRSRPGARRRS